MINCSGYCKKCGKVHSLGEGDSKKYALDLLSQLEKEHRIDLEVPTEKSDPRFSNDCLYSEFRGQMFGVLECLNSSGEKVILKAYSCQHNGIWNCAGWMPPLVDVEKFYEIMNPVEIEIKRLCKIIDSMDKQDTELQPLKKQRKGLSQKLMQDIFSLYSFTNFRGETVGIEEAFCEDKGIPTGTGDCCAPKLLNYAARNRLKPIGISEFFFGRENKSETRKHGEFYPSCKIKCEPILGFMLCGLEDM